MNRETCNTSQCGYECSYVRHGAIHCDVRKLALQHYSQLTRLNSIQFKCLLIRFRLGCGLVWLG